MRVLNPIASAAVIGLVAAVSSTPAWAATVLSVNWGDSCSKNTCFGDDGKHSRTFSAAAFKGPVTIGQLLMQRGVLGSLDGQTFRISFSLNGEEVGTWGHYNMSGIGGDQLGFAGESFEWNPENGDLVLTLALVPPPKAGGGSGFYAAPQEFGADSDDVGLAPSGSSCFRDDGLGDVEPGPDMQRGFAAAAIVPEPASWAMMITGFGLAGAALRRRRAILVV